MLAFAHIALSVSDIGKSIAFYRRHFGFRRAEKYLHKEAGFTIAVLKKGGVLLELFEFKKRKPLPRYRRELESDLRTLGVKHFCFKVKDIAGAYTKLKHARVDFATDMRPFDDGRRYFFIRDPDGILVEVKEEGG